MKIVYGKQLDKQDVLIINDIANQCGILFDTARLLYYRNIDSVQKAKAFLNPEKNKLNSPYLLLDMDKAVERITYAKMHSQNVLIFGDYDADGICATAILYNALKDFGILARKFVPEREENYGLNLDTITKFNQEQKIDLIITVDCGISDRDKIEEIKKLGIDVIVTDHHEPPEDLPLCTKINPKIPNQAYPFKDLCGAGVAYKLGVALIGEKADEYLDFVALATTADSMDLVDENRTLVARGLNLFNDRKKLRLPFKYLLGDFNKEVTAQTLAFTIAPRVNAGGRMGDAATALNLFTSENPNAVFDYAVKLENYNTERQAESENIFAQAKEKILSQGMENDDVILVGDASWRTGVIGIVSAKLVESFARPVIVFAGCDGYLKGSARSVEGFNVYEAICSVKEHLITFGGHAQAAGISVSEENFEKVRKLINDYAKTFSPDLESEQTINVEWEINKPIDIRFAKEVELLEPFGVGNRRPQFSIKVESVEARALKVGSPHYSIKTDVIELLDFNGEKDVQKLSFPTVKDIVFELNLSTYKNNESLKGYVRKVLSNFDGSQTFLPYAFYEDAEKIILGTHIYNVSGLDQLDVSREEFIRIFAKLKTFSNKFYSNSIDFAKRHLPEENLLQVVFVIETFIELKIFSCEKGKFVFDEKIKNALTNSKLYSKIYSLKNNR